MRTIVLLSILSSTLFSEIRIEISEKNKQLISVTKDELARVYLRKTDKIKGVTVIPIDNKESYREFYSKVLKKTPKQLRAYWIKTGKKRPPKKLSTAQIKQEMKKNPKIISYSTSNLTGKILLQVK